MFDNSRSVEQILADFQLTFTGRFGIIVVGYIANTISPGNLL